MIGLTNRPELIDSALLRPGRLEVRLGQFVVRGSWFRVRGLRPGRLEVRLVSEFRF